MVPRWWNKLPNSICYSWINSSWSKSSCKKHEILVESFLIGLLDCNWVIEIPHDGLSVHLSFSLSFSIYWSVFRAPLASPASREPQDLLVTLGSCRGWGRRVKKGTGGSQDRWVSKGQTELEELEDQKVFWDRKETLWVLDPSPRVCLFIRRPCVQSRPVPRGGSAKNTKTWNTKKTRFMWANFFCWLCRNWI